MSYDKQESHLNLINQQEIEQETDVVDEHINLSPLNTRPSLERVAIHSERLNLDFNCYVQNETSPSQQRCYILTIHDIGCDHTEFDEFISCPEMRALRDRIIWIHVDLPGQEANAADLNISKYPSLVELAEELVIILDHFKLAQVTCLGVGAGSNICARFAMRHPNRCLGTVLVHPTGSTATFLESFKDKIKSWRPIKQVGGMSNKYEAYLVWHRFGSSSGDMQLVQANIKEFQAMLYEKRNPKNLALFIESFLNRTNITEKIDDLKVDVLTAVGKRASLSGETKKFYKCLYDSRKNDFQRLVNCPLLEVEDVGDIMGESPDRLAVSLRYFLQGIGLIPATPMKKTLQGLGRMSRAFSMEDADRPRRISFTEISCSPKN